MEGLVLHQLKGEFGGFKLSIAAAGVKSLGPDELPQGVVGLIAGPRRADADNAFGPHPLKHLIHLIRRDGGGHTAPPRRLPQGVAETLRVVHITGAETPPVTEEIPVHLAVVTVDDAAQAAVALPRRGVAAHRAARAHRRRRLQIPLAGVLLAEHLVGENPGGADLHQIAAELALQRPLFIAPEIHMMMTGLGREIGASRIVVVKTHTAVTGDAAVHLMIDERAQILVGMGHLVAVVTPVVMPGHEGHILQMTLAPLLAHRAVVRMADHQALDDAGAEGPGLFVGDGDAGAGGGRGHAGHHDGALPVIGVLILFYRALPAGPHRPHTGVPAEIRQVEAQGQTLLQQVVVRVHLEGLAVYHYVDFRFGHVSYHLALIPPFGGFAATPVPDRGSRPAAHGTRNPP